MRLNKKLILLTSLVMMSLNVFSQNVTKQSSKDTTQIQITKPIARLVIKDLLKGDGMSKEVQTMQFLLTETNNKLLIQNDLVTNLQLQINNYDSTIITMQEQFNTQARLSEDLEIALKRSKRQAKLYKIGSYIGIAAVGILIVK